MWSILKIDKFDSLKTCLVTTKSSLLLRIKCDNNKTLLPYIFQIIRYQNLLC